MPQVERSVRKRFAARVTDALLRGLSSVGIDGDDVEIETQTVPGTQLLRVVVTAKQFAKLQPSERQSLVWRIIEMGFSPEEQLRLSMILALAPDESA